MDENSRLEPHLLIAQAEEGIRIFEAKIERIRASREPKMAFINDTSSSTTGINLLKEKMADMLKVDNALILAYSSYIADYRRLIARLADVPRLHGGLLLALREQARARIGELEIRISDLQRTLSREGTFPNRSENAYHYFRHLITTHTNALERQHNVLQAIEARIELYHVIEAETRHLFEEGRALEQEAMRGFELIQVASSGLPRGFHNPGLTVWRTGLREKKNKLPGPSIEELDLIANIRERGVPFPNGWTDEEQQAFARRYLAELAKVNTFVENSFSEDEFEAAQTAFIFLTDVELAFHLNINKRKDLLNVIRDNGMFFPPIQDYLEEHGLSDISTRRFGNFTMQVGQTYGSASQGMSHHDWYTFLAAASWLDGAGRFGPAVNLASNWNATAPKPTVVLTAHNVDHKKINQTFNAGGERLITPKDLKAFKREMNAIGVKVVIDRKGKVLKKNSSAVGGFNNETGTVYLRPDGTKHAAIHEGLHAKQWKQLGREAYNKQGTRGKEEHVYRELMRPGVLNEAEKGEALKYIEWIRGNHQWLQKSE